MTVTSKFKPRRRGPRRLLCGVLVALLVGVVASCGGGDERPSEAAWIPEWERRQQLIPDVDTILTGGRKVCDDLDGSLRVSLPELLPSPTEALDGPVNEWVTHAVSIVFECSDDEQTIARQLETLDVLAAEIDGGINSGDR